MMYTEEQLRELQWSELVCCRVDRLIRMMEGQIPCGDPSLMDHKMVTENLQVLDRLIDSASYWIGQVSDLAIAEAYRVQLDRVKAAADRCRSK